MALNPRIAELTAINEAISALDHSGRNLSPETGELVAEARDALLTARSFLTDKDWPDTFEPSLNVEAFEDWHSRKAAEQRRDGRQ